MKINLKKLNLKEISLKKLRESQIKLILGIILAVIILGITALLLTSSYYSHKRSSNSSQIPAGNMEANPSEFEENAGKATGDFAKPVEGGFDKVFGKPNDVPVEAK